MYKFAPFLENRAIKGYVLLQSYSVTLVTLAYSCYIYTFIIYMIIICECLILS